jgi:hypothetical protein
MLIDFNNQDVEDQMRENFQKTDQKVLGKVFDRFRRASKKIKVEVNENNAKKDITKMKFFKKLVEKEDEKYERARVDKERRKHNMNEL